MSTELNARVTIGRAVRDARHFDRSRVSVRAGLIAAVPVAGSLAFGTIIDRPDVAVTMGAGAMLGGVAWRAAGPDDPPIGTMAASIAGLGLATVAGSASGQYPWLHVALLAVLTACAGLLASLGRRGSVPGTQAIIAYIVFGRFPQPLGSALGLAGLVVAGGALQAGFAVFVGLPPAWRQQREALAEAYRQLAAIAGELSATTVPAAAALDAAEAKLNAPTLFGDPALMTLSGLVEEGRRIRLELIALHTLGGDGSEAARGAGVLRAIAAGVAQPDGSHQDAVVAAVHALDAPEPVSGNRHVDALVGQLHAAARLTQLAEHHRPWAAARPSRGARRPIERARSDLQQLRANVSLHTAGGRHAARLTVVVVIAELLAQHASLPRGYWAVVAAATVLRPEFGATFTRGAERMAGTVLGVVVATFIAVGLDPSGWGIVAVVGVLAWGTYAVFPASFAAGTALLTGVIAFLLHAVAPDSATIALDRGLDTLIGGTLGLLAYALWPTWSGGSATRVTAELVDAQRAYVVAILDGVVAGTPPEDERLRPLARRARVAWSNADTVITLARREPERRLGDRALQAIATLGGLRRLVYAGHTARVEAGAAAEHARGPRPEWAPLRDGLDRTLRAFAAHIEYGTIPAGLPRLRSLYGEARAAAPLDPALLGAIDELVDATNTVAATLGLQQPS